MSGGNRRRPARSRKAAENAAIVLGQSTGRQSSTQGRVGRIKTCRGRPVAVNASGAQRQAGIRQDRTTRVIERTHCACWVAQARGCASEPALEKALVAAE